MVCERPGYFAILAATPESSPVTSLEKKRSKVMARSSANKPGRPTPDSRRAAVLSAVIDEHLITGDAIGSHTVSDKFSHATGWSSATIRSVMCELEDFGLLEQPHTSAGRIPTDKGYRYYVDNMLDSTRLSKNDLRAIERIDLGHGAKA